MLSDQVSVWLCISAYVGMTRERVQSGSGFTSTNQRKVASADRTLEDYDEEVILKVKSDGANMSHA